MFKRLSPLLFLPVLGFGQTIPPATGASAPGDPAAPVVLDQFVVTSGKLTSDREDIVPSLGAAEFHLDRSQLDALALGSSNGFNEVLLRAPGVAQDSFGQVHLRGEHGDLQYRINDVLLPEGLSGFGQELDTRFAENVNVLTGALPAQYGYRTAGVVDIHTRTITGSGGDLALYGGNFGTRRASAEATTRRGALQGYVTATAEASNLGVENPTPSRDALHDHKSQARVFGDFSYVLDDSSQLSLIVSGSSSRFQIPDVAGRSPSFALAGVSSFDSAAINDTQQEQNDYAIVAYQKSADNLSGQVSAFTRYSRVQFNPDRAGDLMFSGVASAVDRSLVSNGVEADAKWAVAASHTLRAGTLVTSTNAGTRTTTTVFPVNDSGAQSSSVPFDIPEAHRKLGWLGGVYAQDEWAISPQLTLNAGARADTAHGYVSEGQVSPRVNLVYQLSDAATVHIGYARYFTPPPLELVQGTTLASFVGTTNAPATLANSAVRSERADYFDAGVSWKPVRDLSATIDAYDKRATNLLDEGQFGSALIFAPFNFARGHVYGVEVSANFTRGGFTAYANAALSRAKARGIVSGEFQFDPEELAYIADHDVHLDHDQLYTASAGVTYRFGENLVSADFLYGSGLRRGFANTSHLPEYHPMNLGFEHTFHLSGRHEIRARVDVVNVLDETYELRDGSGIGVGAPQFGSRRGLFGGLTFAW